MHSLDRMEDRPMTSQTAPSLWQLTTLCTVQRSSYRPSPRAEVARALDFDRSVSSRAYAWPQAPGGIMTWGALWASVEPMWIGWEGGRGSRLHSCLGGPSNRLPKPAPVPQRLLGRGQPCLISERLLLPDLLEDDTESLAVDDLRLLNVPLLGEDGIGEATTSTPLVPRSHRPTRRCHSHGRAARCRRRSASPC